MGYPFGYLFSCVHSLGHFHILRITGTDIGVYRQTEPNPLKKADYQY